MILHVNMSNVKHITVTIQNINMAQLINYTNIHPCACKPQCTSRS